MNDNGKNRYRNLGGVKKISICSKFNSNCDTELDEQAWLHMTTIPSCRICQHRCTEEQSCQGRAACSNSNQSVCTPDTNHKKS